MSQQRTRLAAVPADAALPEAVPVKQRDRSRERERVRHRPGTRAARALIGKRQDRLAFLELLARHGDPAVAADALGLPLFVLFRHRDADPAFAAEWQAAVSYAWERVESRVLAELLKQVEAAIEPGAGAAGKAKTSAAGLLDSRVVLAIVNRRDKPVQQLGGRAADGAGVARLRAELRALAGPDGGRSTN